MGKRKSQTPAPAAYGNDSDGSDYEVEWQVKPTPPKVTKAEQFPLPAQVAKKLEKSGRRGRKDSSSDDESLPETGEGLPTLTTAQIDAILQTIKNNKRLVLLVKNVNFSTAKEEIAEHFDQAGRVKGVRIPKHRSSGFAFVEMQNADGFQVRACVCHCLKCTLHLITPLHLNRKRSCSMGRTWMEEKSA